MKAGPLQVTKDAFAYALLDERILDCASSLVLKAYELAGKFPEAARFAGKREGLDDQASAYRIVTKAIDREYSLSVR